MKYWLIVVASFLTVSLFSFKNIYSPLHKSERFFLNPSQTEITLSAQNLIVNSEEAKLDSILLKSGYDYSINYKSGTVKLLQNYQGILVINYQIIPPKLNQQTFIFQEQAMQDSFIRQDFKLNKPKLSNSSQITISGNKTISLSVGNNDALDFDQSLFLQLEGNVSDNVKIAAQLSDSQTPFSPEGDSKELSSLDQVMIKIYSEKFDIAFGDLTYKTDYSNLLNAAYNFEGVRARWFTKQNLKGAIAVSKGKHNSVSFSGVEGKQGPYYLDFGESSSGVKVIAGSETIYLDGEKQNRGEDYRIDYDQGTITFYQNRIITSESNIIADFEYSDENYRKNFYLTSGKFAMPFSFEIFHNIVFRNDDKDNPLNQTFTDSDLAILENSGDAEIWVDGAYAVELGEGDYSLSTGENPHYIYTPEAGDYIVNFTYVGANEGSYQRISFSEYEFVGESMGSWIPQRKIVAPQKLDNYNFGINLGTESLNFSSEILLSRFDKNTFSQFDDNDNFGSAYNANIHYSPDFDKVKPFAQFDYNYLSSKLKLFNNIDDANQEYYQSEFSQSDTVQVQKYSLRTGLNIYNNIFWNNHSYYNDYHTLANQLGFDNRFGVEQFRFLPKSQFRVYHLKEDNSFYQFIKKRNLYELDLNYLQKYWAIGTKFSKDYYESNDENAPRDREINSSTYTIKTDNLQLYAGEVSYQQTQKNDEYESDYLANTFSLKQLFSFKAHTYNLRYDRRDIDYEPGSNQNNQSYDFLQITTSDKFLDNAINWQNNYQINNTEFYPKERQLIYVGDSAGLYDSTGVYAEDGEYDWEYVNVGDSKLITETSIDSRVSVQPSYYKPFKENDFLKRIKFSINYLQSEQSDTKDRLRIYILSPEVTFDKQNSIFSRLNLRNSLSIDILKRRLTTKYSFEKDKSLDNRYNSAYKRDFISHDILNRFIATQNTIYEFLLSHSKEEETRYQSFVTSRRAGLTFRKRITTTFDIMNSFSYREEEGEQLISELFYQMNSVEIGSQLTWLPNSKSKAEIEIFYKKNMKSGDDFFNFMSSKRDGDIWNWKLQTDYQYNSFTSINASYNGEKVPQEDTSHTLKVEIIAEF